MEDLVGQAEARVRETDAFYESLGLTRDSAGKFLQSDKLPAEEREKAMRELAQWREEVERDIRHAQDQAKGGSKAPRTKAGLMRV